MTADDVIAVLGLQPHPVEGGFFRETYRSADRFPPAALPTRYGGPRSAGTAIYYLLNPSTFSALHRLPTDEVFHFYLGDPVEMLWLAPDGSGRTVVLGPNLGTGHRPQVVVPRDTWQGACLMPGGAWALLGTTMAPGFDYADYETGGREELCRQYPAWADRINRLTRP
jgi:hypothetical protein